MGRTSTREGAGAAAGSAQARLRPGCGRAWGALAAAPQQIRRCSVRSLLPVLAPAALLIGAGAGAGVTAALTTGGGAPGRPSGTPVVRPMSSYGGTLQGRLQRLLRDSEESGEARVSRAELEQMLDWTQKAREWEQQEQKARGGLAGAPP